MGGLRELWNLILVYLRRDHLRSNTAEFEDWAVRWQSSTGPTLHECDDRGHAEELARNVYPEHHPEIVHRTRVVAISAWQAVK